MAGRRSKTTPPPAAGVVTRRARRKVLASAWCAWIAENLALGILPSALVSRLVGSGVPRALARRGVDEIRVSPALHGVHALLRARVQAELHARLAKALASDRATPTVERRKKPTATEFYDRYWAGNEPVVFTDVAEQWKLWTPRDMKRWFGDLVIEVTDGREGDARYEEHFTSHRTQTTLGAFVDRVVAAGETNDFYMVANNRTMERSEFRVLLERIVIDPVWFDTERLEGRTSLWLGPKGTVTPLHHDTTNILLTQIYGRKQFLLVAPHELSMLRAARGVYVDLDPESPDLGRHPWWRDVVVHRVVLEPGESLFLPAGWWHHVRALDVSISFSLLAFRRRNAFPWYRPGFDRSEKLVDKIGFEFPRDV